MVFTLHPIFPLRFSLYFGKTLIAFMVTEEGADKAARQYARANGYTHYLICQA